MLTADSGADGPRLRWHCRRIVGGQVTYALFSPQIRGPESAVHVHNLQLIMLVAGKRSYMTVSIEIMPKLDLESTDGAEDATRLSELSWKTLWRICHRVYSVRSVLYYKPPPR
jgi:hypothetical protein